jgi:hypothetical protein
LKDTTGNTYWTVFLVSENESFLDGHPKKKVTG